MSKQITQALLAEHRKTRAANGDPPEMWATFAGVLLDAGYFIYSYRGTFETVYLNVGRADKHKPLLVIRCSNHVEAAVQPPHALKVNFYLGTSSYGTTTLMDGLLFVKNYFYGAAK